MSKILFRATCVAGELPCVKFLRFMCLQPSFIDPGGPRCRHVSEPALHASLLALGGKATFTDILREPISSSSDMHHSARLARLGRGSPSAQAFLDLPHGRQPATR